MQLAGKITEGDLNEIRKMARSKTYWPKLIFANWYGLALLGIATWATLSGLIGTMKPNWRAVGLIWLFLAALVAWLIYRMKSRHDAGNWSVECTTAGTDNNRE